MLGIEHILWHRIDPMKVLGHGGIYPESIPSRYMSLEQKMGEGTVAH